MCVWAECDPDAPTEARIFRVVPTGCRVGADEHYSDMRYIGTVSFNNFVLVWHIYELIK